MRYLVTTEALMSGIQVRRAPAPALTGQAWPHGHRNISLPGHPRLMLITECGRLLLAAHAISADLYAITGPSSSRWRRTRTGDLGGARRQGIGHLGPGLLAGRVRVVVLVVAADLPELARPCALRSTRPDPLRAGMLMR
jgi:hypothetical protein